MKKDNIFIIILINVISLVLIFLVTGIISGVILSFIFNEFSFRLIKIVIINSLFVSSGIILNSYVSKFLINKINHIFIIFLSFLMILGFNIVGTVFLFFLEPFYFFYSNNIILPYFAINLFFVLSISIITTGFIIFQETLTHKETLLSQEIILRKQIEEKLFASKINPHFLFNSLNLIISLLKDPVKSEKVLISLSDLLRYNINSSEKKEISIDDELDNVKKYLFIQKERFGGRLDYSINSITNGLIPPLIIQPLVENSIKHNIDSINYLKIEINIEKYNENIIIKIYDSCRKLKPDMLDKGIGLTNTKKRVENAGGNFIIKDGGIEITFNYD